MPSVEEFIYGVYQDIEELETYLRATYEDMKISKQA